MKSFYVRALEYIIKYVMADKIIIKNKNRVACSDDRVVFYHIDSDVDENDAQRLNDFGKDCFEKNLADYVLIDLKASTEFSSVARKIWVEFLQDARIKKTAIFGGNVFVRTLASFVIAATGKRNIKFFSVEKNARAWFNE